MKEIYYHRVEITDGTGLIQTVDGFFIVSLPVLLESDTQLVVQLPKHGGYSVIQKKPSDYQTSLDSRSISLSSRDNVWGSRIAYSLFSEKRRKARDIRKDIEKAVLDKFGFFLNGIDLSVVKD